MQREELILADEFCVHHDIEISFIHSLSDRGLLEVSLVEEKIFLPVNQLCQLEKMVRWHYEMDINLEGIETIHHLLQQMDQMQRQILQLSNRLKQYETE
jgi:chaperone modulatory protein CbpM